MLIVSALLLAAPAAAAANQTWGYQDCNQKEIVYPYPNDPSGRTFPPGSCPPPGTLKLECPKGTTRIKPVDASSSTYEKGFMHPPRYAIDEHLSTRWSSTYSDDQWIVIDLGAEKALKKLHLVWELAHGSQYVVFAAPDKEKWASLFTNVYTELDGDGFVDSIDLDARGRYLKIQGIKRAKVGNEPLYGYSLFDVVVCGGDAPPAPPPAKKPPAGK